MKIVHSFWSKPFQKNEKFNNWDRSSGGWFERRFNYYSWALSCLKFSQFYDNVELYTDDFGYDLFINKIQLPYTKAFVELNKLNDYHHDLWALGKLYTYQLQKEPFLHVDGDVFIWKKFSEEYHTAQLVVQNLEDDFEYYTEVFNELKKEFKYIPELILEHEKRNVGFSGINAGVFGGTNLDFIQDYVSIAMKFVNENVDCMSNIKIGLFNNFYEQCLFRLLAESSQLEIVPLINNVNDRFDGLCELTGVPNNKSYVHTVGVYKKRKETHELVEYRLKTEFPEYYYRINNLIKEHLI